MSRMRYVAVIDQGTTSSRCAIVDQAGSIWSIAQLEHRQLLPAPGLVEHDPAEIPLAQYFFGQSKPTKTLPPNARFPFVSRDRYLSERKVAGSRISLGVDGRGVQERIAFE